LIKAVAAKNSKKVETLYKKLIKAKLILIKAEADQLS